MLTRRALFQATAAAGITAAVGPETTKPHAALFAWARAPGKSTAFTFADLLRAEAMLNAANVPRFGGYTMFLQPDQYEDVTLDSLTINAPYRVRETAWSLMRHERRRQKMGNFKRPPPLVSLPRLAPRLDYPATVTIPTNLPIGVAGA